MAKSLLDKARDFVNTGVQNVQRSNPNQYNIFANLPQVQQDASRAVDAGVNFIQNNPASRALQNKTFDIIQKNPNGAVRNIVLPSLAGASNFTMGVGSLAFPQLGRIQKENALATTDLATRYKIPQQIPLVGGQSLPQLAGSLLVDPTNYIPIAKGVKGASVGSNLARKYGANVGVNSVQGLLQPAENLQERAGNVGINAALGVAIPGSIDIGKAGFRATKEALSNQAVDVQRQAIKSLLSTTNSRISSAFKSAFSLPESEFAGVLQQFNAPNVGMISGMGSESGLKQITKRFAPIMADQDITQQRLFWNMVDKVKKNVPLQKGDVPSKLQPLWKKATKDASKFIGQKGSIKIGGFDESDINIPDQPQLPKPTQQIGTAEMPPVKTTYEKGATVVRDPSGNIMAYSAAPTQKIRDTLAKSELKAQAQTAKAEFTEWKKQVNKQEGATIPATPVGAAKQAASQIKTNTVGATARGAEQLNDLSGFMAQTRDVYRNFRAVYGNRFNQVKKELLDPFDQSKGQFIDDQKALLNELDEKVVKGLGIKKGSKESAAVMQFGEKKRDFASLLQEFGEEKAKKIVQADAFFRQKYDSLLDQVNEIRQKIYPNNPEKIIPKRGDYYRHFKEMQDGFQGLANIFETPSSISSKLSGISPDTKPKSKFLSFAQRRIGDRSDLDAVGGFLDYAKSWSYAKNIDPHIQKFRALADDLASQTSEGPNAGRLNNFIEYLQDYANDLAGKTNPADRFLQKIVPGGRTAFKALNWVNNRVKANTIVGNAGSMVAQVFNLPQGIASAGPQNSLKGMNKTMLGIFQKGTPIDRSNFIKERYASSMYDKFDTGILSNTKNFVSWLTGVGDEVATKVIWNSHYEKAIQEGISNPVKYADDMTRSLVAGRGIGETPLIQNSKIFQLVAPFQLEVGNLWHVMGEFAGQKQFGKLATMFVTTWMMNRIAEQIRGSDVGFDPIEALREAYATFNEEDDKVVGALKAGGRVTGEVISNLPLGQSMGSLYPEYGFKVNDAQFPTRENFFGDADPTRFGGGLLAQQALEDPLFKLLPAYGGGQLKKTIEGLQTYNKGYSETQSGRVRFPVEQNGRNFAQSALFGQYSTPDARRYFDSGNTPLGEVQSQDFKDGGGKDLYEGVMMDRQVEREDKKLEPKEDERSFFQKLFSTDSEVESASAAVDSAIEQFVESNSSELTPLQKEQLKKDIKAKKREYKKILYNKSLSDDEKNKQLGAIEDQIKSLQESDNKKKIDYTKMPLTGDREIDKEILEGAQGNYNTRINEALEKFANGKITAGELKEKLGEYNYKKKTVGELLKLAKVKKSKGKKLKLPDRPTIRLSTSKTRTRRNKTNLTLRDLLSKRSK